MSEHPRFAAYAAEKTRAASRADLHPLQTIDDRSPRYNLRAISTEWTRELYGGPFYLAPAPPDRPAVSLVFVESRDGNTGADDPGDLGGGDTDKHLIYEGLSRVAADAVMAGAKSVGPEAFFSVWHPELVALRLALGLPRHPAQIVITSRTRELPDVWLMRTAPDVPLHVIALKDEDITTALARLQSEFGIRRISCVGGRTTATTLMDAGVVQEVYLTTTNVSAGEPNTPWYVGDALPALEEVVTKRAPNFVFRHLLR